MDLHSLFADRKKSLESSMRKYWIHIVEYTPRTDLSIRLCVFYNSSVEKLFWRERSRSHTTHAKCFVCHWVKMFTPNRIFHTSLMLSKRIHRVFKQWDLNGNAWCCWWWWWCIDWWPKFFLCVCGYLFTYLSVRLVHTSIPTAQFNGVQKIRIV